MARGPGIYATPRRSSSPKFLARSSEVMVSSHAEYKGLELRRPIDWRRRWCNAIQIISTRRENRAPPYRLRRPSAAKTSSGRTPWPQRHCATDSGRGRDFRSAWRDHCRCHPDCGPPRGNHQVNLSNPGTNLNSGSTFGKITTANAMRQVQLGLRLTFQECILWFARSGEDGFEVPAAAE